MKVSIEDVKHVANLARLELTDDEQSSMKSEMSKILSWMDKLNELQTNGVKPLIHMSSEVNILRNDEKGNILDHDRALENGPKTDTNYFRVPKVIE